MSNLRVAMFHVNIIIYHHVACHLVWLNLRKAHVAVSNLDV